MTEREIFIAALHEPSADGRAAFLGQACKGDVAVTERVAALLREHDQLGDFLESPAFAAADKPQVTEGVGTVIGPYKLMEQIGEGGMGLVFVAEQTEPVRRRVAVKVIKPGMDTKEVVARFEAERQALALMGHPNIAQVFDAGTTDTGRPYFVMELVRGLPITDYCDQARLPTADRLKLFVRVCRAVQHAHQKGVIHRDLKPSNILVTLHDGEPVPKVIDFGVAKAVNQRLSDKTVYTRLAQLVGTPLYMSPEQAEMSGLDVDTRSDVYSLGVLLYELLTGTTPFEPETLKQVGFDEMRRLIREEQPPRPSRRLNTLDARACSTVSERRGVDGRQLGQLMRGELDWVVMRALEKDRNRRYESASALAADVERYLADEPVEAGPPSAVYRLRKYVRRNRRILATAGVVAVALVGATVVSTWQAVKAREAQNKAEAAEYLATTEAAVARAVNDFLDNDLLGKVDSVSQLGDEFGGIPELTVKEALDRAAAVIGERFQDQPLVEASIRMVIGKAYKKLARHQFAVAHLERALALRRTHLGPDHTDTVACMGSLADACQWEGRHSDAIALRRKVVEYRTARLGQDHPETLASMVGLATTYQLAGGLVHSVPLLEQVVENHRRIFGPKHALTLWTMQNLAMNYTDAGRFAESMDLHETVLTARRSTLGPGDPLTTWCLRTYAQTCLRTGQLDRAERLLREAVEHERKQEDSLGRRNGQANTLGWLATALQQQGRYEEAESFARAAVALNQQEEHRRLQWVSLLGAVLVARQKYDEAEPLLLRAYEGMKKREGLLPANEKQRLAEAGERVVHFYEVTGQPETAREWREKLALPRGPDRGP